MPKLKQKVLNKKTYEDLWDEKVKKMFSDMGKKGGATTKKKGQKYFKEMGRKGAAIRWGKTK